MRIPIFTFCSVILILNANSLEVKQYDADTFFNTISIFEASFSSDETRLLINTDKSGVINVYSQPIAGGPPVQLTQSDKDYKWGHAWFPNDDRFLYTSDKGGNELNHIYVQLLDGTSIDLTPGENNKAMFEGWAGDDQRFWITNNERDSKFFDLYEYCIDTFERKMIFENNDGYSPEAISLDGRWIALLKIHNNADNDIYLFDVQSPNSEPKYISPHKGDISHGIQTFTPDCKEFYYTSNEGSEFDRLWAYDLNSGKKTLILQEQWDILNCYFSRNGRYQVTAVNADAQTQVTIFDTKTKKNVPLPDIPEGDIHGISISRSGKYMAFYVDSDTSPSNLYILYLQNNAPYRRLTTSLSDKINQDDLVLSKVVRYPSFDDLKIPAILYKPKQSSQENKVPALVYVHGGPGGQSRKGYNALLQFLINHGYAVLAVNNRGSSGYGKTFFHLDDKKHGDVDLKDCIFGRRYLESLDWIDSKHIGIMGESYGGYMVSAALTFEPDAFDLGINVCGITNLVRTLNSIPTWWAAYRESMYAELGDPSKEEERLRNISPLFHAANIKKPLLVAQGKNDPRVLQVESDEIVVAARKNNIPVEYLVFDDEGHGFMKKVNQITAAEAYLNFVDKYLHE